MQCAQVFMLWIGSLEPDILGFEIQICKFIIRLFYSNKVLARSLGKENINSVSTMSEGLIASLTGAKEFVVVVTVIFDEH